MLLAFSKEALRLSCLSESTQTEKVKHNGHNGAANHASESEKDSLIQSGDQDEASEPGSTDQYNACLFLLVVYSLIRGPVPSQNQSEDCRNCCKRVLCESWRKGLNPDFYSPWHHLGFSRAWKTGVTKCNKCSVSWTNQSITERPSSPGLLGQLWGSGAAHSIAQCSNTTKLRDSKVQGIQGISASFESTVDGSRCFLS